MGWLSGMYGHVTLPSSSILRQCCTFWLVPASPSHRVEGLLGMGGYGEAELQMASSLPWDLSHFLLLLLTGGYSLSQERGPP